MAISPPEKQPHTPTVDPKLVSQVIDQGINLVNKGVESLKSAAENLGKTLDKAAKKLGEITKPNGAPTNRFDPNLPQRVRRGEVMESFSMESIEILELKDPKKIKELLDQLSPPRPQGEIMHESRGMIIMRRVRE